MSPVLLLTSFFWVLPAAESYYFFYTADCYDSGQNIEVLISLIYNKEKFLTYNSTENKVVGYSEYGIKWADEFNSKPDWLHKEIEKVLLDCRRNRQLLSAVDKTVKPKVMLRSLRSASEDQPAVLMCSAYDFYPKPIRLTWLRNGQEVTTEVVSTEEMADGDWHYQIHSQLEFTPRPAENISCMVEHLSFTKPALFHWSNRWSLSDSEKDRIVVGAAGLLLGGVTAVTGLVYSRRKERGGPQGFRAVYVPPSRRNEVQHQPETLTEAAFSAGATQAGPEC